MRPALGDFNSLSGHYANLMGQEPEAQRSEHLLQVTPKGSGGVRI